MGDSFRPNGVFGCHLETPRNLEKNQKIEQVDPIPIWRQR